MLVFCTPRESQRARETDGTSWGLTVAVEDFEGLYCFRTVPSPVVLQPAPAQVLRMTTMSEDPVSKSTTSDCGGDPTLITPVQTASQSAQPTVRQTLGVILTDIPFVGSERKNRSGCRASPLSFGQSSEGIVSPFGIEFSSGAGSDSLRTRFNVVLEDSGDGSEFPERKQGMLVGTKESQKTELTDSFVLLAAAVTASRLARPSSKVRDRCWAFVNGIVRGGVTAACAPARRRRGRESVTSMLCRRGAKECR